MRVFKNFRGTWGLGTQERVKLAYTKQNNHVLAYLSRKLCIFDMAILRSKIHSFLDKYIKTWSFCLLGKLKVTVDLRGVFWGKQYSALCINGIYINLYIIGELI